MVLQRDHPIRIFGKYQPGLDVHLRFGSLHFTANTSSDSTWSIQLPAMKASAIPRDIFIHQGSDTLWIKDILIGDVWVCIGQSNMEWPMSREMHFAEEVTQAEQPLIRLFNPSYAGKNTFGIRFSDSIVQMLTVGDFFKGKWQRSDSMSFRTMSAVGWYFARSIAGSEKIPVGLMNFSVGGAPLEAIMSLHSMAGDQAFSKKLRGNWLYNEHLPVWIRERALQNVGGIADAPSDSLGPAHGFKPGFIYHAGLEPVMKLPIKGLLCYQGESNAQEEARVQEYPDLFVKMTASYRDAWQQPDLPMYFVQLSSIDTLRYKGHLWPSFRDGQRRIISLLPHSGMAVSHDRGLRDDVHPTDKKVIGHRLARWALHDLYGQRVMPSGPLPIKAVYRRGKVRIHFTYARGGLATADGQMARGFSLDGRQPVHAHISGKKVSIPATERPAYIYFGWKPFTDANLCNRDRLPASSFRLVVD